MVKNKFALLCGIILFLSCKPNQHQNFKNELSAIDSIYSKHVNSRIDAHLYAEISTTVDSVFYSNKSLGLANSIKYYYTKTWLNNHFGYYNKTIAVGDSLIDLIEKNNLQNELYDEYNLALAETALAYFSINNFDKAYQQYFKAQNFAVSKKDNCLSAYILSNLGLISYKQELYEDAIKYFKQEFAYSNKCSYNFVYRGGSMKQACLDNIGLAFTKMNKLDSAIIYYNLALLQIESDFKNDANKTAAAIAYSSRKGVVFGNLAKVYVKENKLDSAETLYRQAIQLNAKPNGDIKDAQLCQVQLAALLLTNNKLNECKTILNQLKQSLDTIDHPRAKQEWLEQMSNYNKATNNMALYATYFKQFITFRDSLNQAKKGLSETNITQELKDKQQQLQITLLQKDNQLNKSYLLIVIMACVLLAVIATIIFKTLRKTKSLNATISKQKDALQKANKDKDRILNVVAHDLRNPIGAITNFLNIALVKYEHSDDENKILTTSKQASENALILINDLLEVNQMQDGNLQLNKTAVDVIKLVEQSIDYLKYKAKVKQQNIVFNTTLRTCVIDADAEKLQRVIINLLENAVKFSYLNKDIVVKLAQENNQIKLSVKDSGVGIPQHLIEQLFTASITVKRTGTNNEKSHGLGLTICKQIIEAHQGTITVTSEEGKGSCFVVQLPC